MSTMSDSLMAFQPAIEEPSNIRPSAQASSCICETSMVRCCILPRGSVKRRSTYLTSLSLISARTPETSMGLLMMIFLWSELVYVVVGLERVRAGLAGADADGLLDVGDENLAVADAAGARRVLDGLDGALHELVRQHHL